MDQTYAKAARPLVVPYQYLFPSECDRLKAEAEPEAHVWGTYGPEMAGPLRWVSLPQLETDHLENILITQRHLDPALVAAILKLLHERYLNEVP